MTKSLKAILIVIAAALIFVIAGGLIIHFVRNGKDSGTIDTNNTLATQVDECVLQESIAFCGDGVSAKTTKPMSLSTYSETASEEQVVSGNSTTLTLKLISNVLSEVVLEKINVPVTWNVAFVNADSAWASGKNVTDYVTVTPKSDFTRTVTVTNKAAFGEQIRLTATLDGDSSKTASCTIDYVKRFGGGLQTLYFASDFGDELNIGGNVYTDEAVGTITGELNAYGTYVELESGFISLVQSYLKFDVQLHSLSFPSSQRPSYINYHPTYKYYAFEVVAADEQGNSVNLDYSHFISNWESLTEAQKTAVKFAWWKAYQEYGDNIAIDLVFDYNYGGKALGQISGNQSSYVSGECYGDGITVDGSLVNIVF